MTIAQFHARRRFVDLPPGRVAYVEAGAGPAALFCHGYFLNGYQWRGQLDRLAAHRRCIAPDFLGLGYTEARAEAAVSPRAQAQMLSALLDKLAVDAVDVICSDSGGAAAQMFIALAPDRVRSVLFTNCEVNEDSPPRAITKFVDMARAGTQVDGIVVPWQRDHNYARSRDQLGAAYARPETTLTDELLDCYLAPLVSSPLRKRQADVYLAAGVPNELPAIADLLRRCQAPVRVVWGTADNVMDAGSPDWIDHNFPSSRGVRRLPGGKLFFPEEEPDVIAAELRTLWGV
jgi:pimeloyl-ACP methyl ester carboxylesterase